MMQAVGSRILVAALVLCPVPFLRADQVAMQNGDKYNGNVLSVTTSAVVLQNDNLGRVTLARSNIVGISFGKAAAKGSSPVTSSPGIRIGQPVTAQTNAGLDLPSALRGIRDQTNLIQQVQSQFLDSASPNATSKFNEFIKGLGTGEIDLNGLRAEAQSAADQLRSLKKDVGPDSSGAMDSYLAILDSFLQETATANVAANSSNAVPKVQSGSGQVQPPASRRSLPPQASRSTNQPAVNR